ncbi:MAG TPA: M56 family metallopeptidase [Sphingomicrobium sp.]|nr:M56 family metallopeptidase [Sphingomicrobium sp.]
MAGLDFQTVAQLGAGRMLNSTAEGLILAALSWAILRLFRVRTPKTRFTLWFLTLLVTVSLPFLAGSGRTAIVDGWHEPQWMVPSAWAWGLFIAWATIAALLVLRLAVSFWQIEKLRRESRDIDAGFNQVAAEALEHSGLKRRVRFCSSTEVAVPTTIGFFRPTVVLPRWALSELSREELKLVLLHELAHLGRGDDWTNLFQKLLKSLFFFHPALYWIEARLALEREMACDELVIEETRNPHAYGRSLVSLAQGSLAGRAGLGRAWALAQSALGRMKHASLRLLAILSPARAQGDPGRGPALLAIAAMAALALFAMPYAPELIVFRPPQVNHQASRVATAFPAASAAKIAAADRAEKTFTPQAPPAVIPARARPSAQHRPALVLAKARARVPSQPEGIVLIESTRWDASGAVVSRISVWRVKLGHRSAQTLEQMIVMQVI